MDLGIRGKVALVMGASQGLGYAVAKALKDEGARVILSSRPSERLINAAKELNAEGYLEADLQKPGDAKRLVLEAQKKFGRLDILVTNAGGPPKTTFEDSTAAMWSEAYQGLWLSALEGIQCVLPSMKQNRWGRILLITSIAAKEPMKDLTLSNGFRAGLLGMTKSISNEVAGFGITINALLPGFTETERLKALQVPMDKISSSIPAGRVGRPEEFAALAAFLSSEPAAYITGQAIACDGGYLRGL